MRIADLVTDFEYNRLSHTKLWANIGYIALTVAFLRSTWMGTATYDLFLAYGGLLALSAGGSKWLSTLRSVNENPLVSAHQPSDLRWNSGVVRPSPPIAVFTSTPDPTART